MFYGHIKQLNFAYFNGPVCCLLKPNSVVSPDFAVKEMFI